MEKYCTASGTLNLDELDYEIKGIKYTSTETVIIF